MIGIYKITNKINNLVYVGQSINVEKRWNAHKKRPFNKKSKDFDIPLYKDIREYGLSNFNFELIEECPEEELNEKEQYWIQYYNSFFNGYNESVGGSVHCRKSNISKEKIIGVIADLKSTNMIHKEIAKKWNISIEMVQGINTGRYWKHNISYPIQNIKNQRKTYINKCKVCGNDFETDQKEQEYCSRKCFHVSQRKSKRPSKEDLFELIKTTPFTQIGNMFNVSGNAIRKWCKTYGLPYKQKDIKNILKTI